MISIASAVNPANMKMAALSGFVKTKEGNAIKGVTVTSGTTSVTTGADGGFILETVNSVNGRTIVTFEADGYTKVTRAAKTLAGDVWEVAMNYQWGRWRKYHQQLLQLSQSNLYGNPKQDEGVFPG